MIWPGALQRQDTFQRLEPHGNDVRAVTLYTHTFVLGEEGGLADDREHPFYTATADTPQKAEQQAHMVYLRAMKCKHRYQHKNPTLQECSRCGLQKRVQLGSQDKDKKDDKGGKKSEKKFFKWF